MDFNAFFSNRSRDLTGRFICVIMHVIVEEIGEFQKLIDITVVD